VMSHQSPMNIPPQMPVMSHQSPMNMPPQMPVMSHQSPMNMSHQMPVMPHQSHMNLRQLPNQLPMATVPPNPVVNVEPVKPVGTPVPFYPPPPPSHQAPQKRVSFLDEAENRIEKMLNASEEPCQTTCSISKILQKSNV
jgi:hypothetical protein